MTLEHLINCAILAIVTLAAGLVAGAMMLFSTHDVVNSLSVATICATLVPVSFRQYLRTDVEWLEQDSPEVRTVPTCQAGDLRSGQRRRDDERPQLQVQQRRELDAPGDESPSAVLRLQAPARRPPGGVEAVLRSGAPCGPGLVERGNDRLSTETLGGQGLRRSSGSSAGLDRLSYYDYFIEVFFCLVIAVIASLVTGTATEIIELDGFLSVAFVATIATGAALLFRNRLHASKRSSEDLDA